MKMAIYRGNAKGEVVAPASKSYTIRSLICASLAKGESEIISPLVSDDSLASRDILKKIGVEIQEDEDFGAFRETIFINLTRSFFAVIQQLRFVL